MIEFLKLLKIDHLVIEPSKYLSAACEQKGLKTLVKFLENAKKKDFINNKKTFVSFELFEHLHDPKAFLNTLKKLMNKKDLFIFTTLSGMGLDIRTLWENSKAISPPMHLNFLNPKSITMLLKKVGFEILEINTPGKLDIDIMSNNKNYLKDKFWRDFLEYADIKEKRIIKKIISENQLSSHMMVVCRKI